MSMIDAAWIDHWARKYDNDYDTEVLDHLLDS